MINKTPISIGWQSFKEKKIHPIEMATLKKELIVITIFKVQTTKKTIFIVISIFWDRPQKPCSSAFLTSLLIP